MSPQPDHHCLEHSGIAAELAANTRAVDAFHRRFDEMEALMKETQNNLNERILRYGEETTMKMADFMKIMTDPNMGVILGENGLDKRVSKVESALSWTWKIATGIGVVVGVLAAFCRPALERAVVWFFTFKG